jgi:hypothetical protein
MKHIATVRVTKDRENVTKIKGLVSCITFTWRTYFFDYLSASFQLRILDGVN